MQTIVIVGGGAGGLELATRLGDSAGKAGSARIVLVDRWPAHFWKPLLHTVASGKRDPQVSQIDYAAQACEHGFEFSYDVPFRLRPRHFRGSVPRERVWRSAPRQLPVGFAHKSGQAR